mgnify:CR=1 FL=1
MKTTRRYPYTRQQAEEAIARAVQYSGPNHATGGLSYRNDRVRPCDGLVAFSYIESHRTPVAYRRCEYAS